MTATEYVVLVDENDNEIGTAEKLLAHQKNMLHRAFSVFIFRHGKETELLLQQRAMHKYHSYGLWTNTCCSHPRTGETIVQAGVRRLREELGISTTLTTLGWFHYNSHFENGLSENEIDHVLVGTIRSDAEIAADPNEVHACRWVTIAALEKELAHSAEQFTPWFAEAFAVAKKYLTMR